VPTARAVADHARLLAEADLRFPILLCANGRVMDGRHRVATPPDPDDLADLFSYFEWATARFFDAATALDASHRRPRVRRSRQRGS